jgi:hypothetical protein
MYGMAFAIVVFVTYVKRRQAKTPDNTSSLNPFL